VHSDTSRQVWLVAVTVCVAALAVYVFTLSPGITWRHDGADSGELVAAALTGGVPHPPGYPTYMLLAGLFARLPIGEPALGVNLLSAVCAALCAALTAWASFRLCLSSAGNAHRDDVVACSIIAAVVGLLLAFSPTLWSQAVIAEVYGLNAAFVAGLLLVCVIWLAGDPPVKSFRWTLWGAAFVLGLGAGNHLSLLLFLPALLLAAWPARRRPGTWAVAAGCLLLGLAIYLTLPLRARSGSPINWGNPQTLDGFVWLVSGRLYRPFVFGYPLSDLPGRLAAWATLLRQQFGLWGAGVGLVGLWYLFVEKRRVFAVTLLAYLLYVAYAAGYDTADSHIYLIPGYVLVSLWIGYGLWSLWREWRRLVAGRPIGIRLAPALLCLALPLIPLLTNWPAMDVSDDRVAQEYARQALSAAAPDALLLTQGDRPTFALWYAHYGLGMRPDLTVVSVSLWPFSWYRETLHARSPAATAVSCGAPPETLDGLIALNRGRREVYLAGGGPPLDAWYSWQIGEYLWRLDQGE
jgi:hypothetical protein